jgi:glycosyltransferase involved in cell wall biosynthesis
VIVSDNCSADDIGGYVAGLGDQRVKYFRTSEVVPVTENWNRALDLSSGEYVLMLGDDDGLMPDYFEQAVQAIDRFDEPDFLYSRALLLAYPGVIPGHESGYVHPMGCATFFDGLTEPRLLARASARKLVRASMGLRLRFDFNMQLFTIRRSTIESLRRGGRFFHSPFPDYYAANLLFLRGERIVIHPEPLAVVGITPRSYGFFHFNRRDQEGAELLWKGATDGARGLERVLLPGSRMNTCWLLAMETLARLEGRAVGRRPNRRRYRVLQMVDALRRRLIEGSMTKEEFGEFASALRPWERLAYWGAARGLLLTRTAGQRGRVLESFERFVGQYPSPTVRMIPGEYRTVLDVFDRAPTRARPG